MTNLNGAPQKGGMNPPIERSSKTVKIRDSHISHIPRKKLGLSIVEYGIVDSIHQQQGKSGWCKQSRRDMASQFGITRPALERIIYKLAGKQDKSPAVKERKQKPRWKPLADPLIEINDSDSKLLCSTELWFNTAVIYKGDPGFVDDRYTLISHRKREKLGMTFNEYAVANSIDILSNGGRGWCTASREKMSDFLGISRATFIRLLNKLEKEEFIEKSKCRALRITEKWKKWQDSKSIKSCHNGKKKNGNFCDFETATFDTPVATFDTLSGNFCDTKEEVKKEVKKESLLKGETDTFERENFFNEFVKIYSYSHDAAPARKLYLSLALSAEDAIKLNAYLVSKVNIAKGQGQPRFVPSPHKVLNGNDWKTYKRDLSAQHVPKKKTTQDRMRDFARHLKAEERQDLKTYTPEEMERLSKVVPKSRYKSFN